MGRASIQLGDGGWGALYQRVLAMEGAAARGVPSPSGTCTDAGVSPALATWTPDHSRLALSRDTRFQGAWLPSADPLLHPATIPADLGCLGWEGAWPESCPKFRPGLLLPRRLRTGRQGTGGHQSSSLRCKTQPGSLPLHLCSGHREGRVVSDAGPCSPALAGQPPGPVL